MYSPEIIDTIWRKIDEKLCRTAVRSADKLPYTAVDGVHDNKAETDITWWTNGFWPALMWLMYLGTGRGVYRAVAEKAELLLDGAFLKYDGLHHDVGFMWHISSGVNYRLFGGEKSRLRTLYAADILAARFNPMGRFIRSWNDDRVGWVIIDSMMNIPLLYWAEKEHGDPRYGYVARLHADTVLRSHIRDDGSVSHIVSLSPSDGSYIESFGGQGYGVGSSWSRGQAWAIYGFALSYIHTGDERYLAAARRVADYFISCVEKTGYVARADFRAPAEPDIIDSTASAIAACGLLELGEEKYRRAAIETVLALEKYCDFSPETDALLTMGAEAYHGRRGLPVIYGDFFYAEAIYKLRGGKFLFW